MIARTVSRATTATTWPPRTIRLTSTAGRQLSSPSRMMNAPTGRAVMAKPLPDPVPWPCGSSPPPGAGATLDPGGGDDGHAVLLIGLAEHPLDGQRIARLADDVLHFHALLPSLVPSSILPAWQLMERSIPSFSTIVQDRLMVLARQAPWSATV
jgi:hypothetical protein